MSFSTTEALAWRRAKRVARSCGAACVRQLKTAKRLRRLLDEADQRSSPTSFFGTLANCKSGCRSESKTRFPAKDSLGYGHLEKVVSTYQKWRTTQPDAAAIDDEIQALISGASSAPWGE